MFWYFLCTEELAFVFARLHGLGFMNRERQLITELKLSDCKSRENLRSKHNNLRLRRYGAP